MIEQCLPQVTQIAAGFEQSCSLQADGAVRCWGRSTYLGYGDNQDRSRPDPLPLSLPAGFLPQQLRIGSVHICLLSLDGRLLCWGNNFSGRLGYGDQNERLTPPSTYIHLGTGRTAKHIALGSGGHTCAILDDDSLKCWGSNNNGQLGYNDTALRLAPAPLPVNLGAGRTAKHIAVGNAHTCAILDDDSLKCWGNNNDGWLGYNDTTQRLAPDPQPIHLGVGRTAKHIALSSTHTCAILDDNSLKCWGRNNDGQLGYNDTTRRLAPDPLPVNLGAGRTAKQIATQHNRTCAILDDNSL
jgi:alpha-tubulin suppressor-like RCC1 family protein